MKHLPLHTVQCSLRIEILAALNTQGLTSQWERNGILDSI